MSHESRFDRASWLILSAAGLFWLVALAHAEYRLALPSDGWLRRGAEGTAYTLGYYAGAGPTPLAAGDVLLAVDGQPYPDLVSRALAVQPRLPAGWAAGGIARYTVLRSGAALNLDVPLGPASGWAPFAHPDDSGQALFALLLLLFLLALFCLRPRNPAARLLLWLAVLLNTPNFPLRAVDTLYPAAYWPAAFFNLYMWWFLIGPILVHLFQIFPRPKAALAAHPRRWRLGIHAGLPALGLVAQAGLAPRLGFWPAFNTVNQTGYILVMGCLVLSLGHSFVVDRQPDSRAQLRWVAFGLLVGLGGGFSAYALQIWLLPRSLGLELLAGCLVMVLPLSLAIAVLRYRLFDIDVIIHRTLVYGALTGILALVYFASVVFLQQLFRRLVPLLGLYFPQQQLELMTAISTLLIAALFAPLRRAIQGRVDRHFYRHRYDAARALTAFAAALRDEVDLDALSGRLLSVVDETMQPTHASLWLGPSISKPTAGLAQGNPLLTRTVRP